MEVDLGLWPLGQPVRDYLIDIAYMFLRIKMKPGTARSLESR